MKDKTTRVITNILKTEHGFEASNPKKLLARTVRLDGQLHISNFAPKNHHNYLRYKRLKKGLSLRCLVSA